MQKQNEIMGTVFCSSKFLACGVAVLLILMTSCTGPQPVLYPNAHFQNVGKEQAEYDIAECRNMAEEYVSSGGAEEVAGKTVVGAGVGAASGAVGGAVVGAAISAVFVTKAITDWLQGPGGFWDIRYKRKIGQEMDPFLERKSNFPF